MLVHGEAHLQRRASTHIACWTLMAVIFVFDLYVPLGVAMGVPYASVVLISLWSPGRRFTVLVAGVASVLTVGAFFAAPPVPEMWKVVFNRLLALTAICVTAWLGLQLKASEEDREHALRERERAVEDLRVLRGVLPICAACKRIRDDQGSWTQLEAYIRAHSEAMFSHGICPDCMKRLYPGRSPGEEDFLNEQV